MLKIKVEFYGETYEVTPMCDMHMKWIMVDISKAYTAYRNQKNTEAVKQLQMMVQEEEAFTYPDGN